MKRIKLKYTTDVARVSKEDYEALSLYQWHLHITPDGMKYARAKVSINGYVYMHDLIKPTSKNQHIVHRDNNGLNNTRLNLKKESR